MKGASLESINCCLIWEKMVTNGNHERVANRDAIQDWGPAQNLTKTGIGVHV